MAISVAALVTAACSGKSEAQKGTGGTGAGAAGGAGGATGGTGGAAGKGATGGSSGSGGAEGGASGSGGSAGSAQGGSAGSAQGGSAGSGGSAGTGAVAGEGGEGGGMEDDRPVLERPVREEYACDVTTPITNLGVDWANGDIAATANGTFVAWGRPASTGVDDAVMLASISDTGMLGAPEPLTTFEGVSPSRPRISASSRGLSVAWAQAEIGEMSTLNIAELDAMGNVTKMPKAVPGIAERITDPAVAPTADGNALLFLHMREDYTNKVPRFALLDADGALSGNLVDVGPALDQGQMQSGELVAIPGGFAATYTTWTGTVFETILVFLDASGAVQGDPVRLNGARPYIGQSLLVHGGVLIVAHGDEEGGYENADIAGYIALSRFDLGTRARLGTDVRVQSPVVNEETVNPVLFPVGEDVGLLWSRGSVIYICAGCMPDNHLEAVVMDGDDFTPLTEMLTFPNDQPMGGYVRPLVAPVGERFAVVTDLRFHVSGVMATGAFECAPVP